MRSLSILVLGALLMMMPSPGFAGDASPEEVRASLKAAEEGFASAFADRDLQAFASFIDDDAVFLNRDGSAQSGKAEVVEGWKGMVTSEKPPFSWGPSRWRVNPSGTMGISSGPVISEGKTVGSFMSIWKRQADGSWKIIFDGGCECPK